MKLRQWFAKYDWTTYIEGFKLVCLGLFAIAFSAFIVLAIWYMFGLF